jgi:hypothetical protein
MRVADFVCRINTVDPVMTTARISLDIRCGLGPRQTTELFYLDDWDYSRKDVRKARLINPKSKELAVTLKLKFAYPAKRNSNRRLAVLRSPCVLVQQVRRRYSINCAIDRYFSLSSRMRCSKWRILWIER